MEDLHRLLPEADIIYGQDLCHQVPAAVRFSEGSAENKYQSTGIIGCRTGSDRMPGSKYEREIRFMGREIERLGD